MPLKFHCSKKPPLDPLPPIPIPGMDGVMSNDGVAVVFNLDPRLQEHEWSKNPKMTHRGGGFLNSLRASFSNKNPRIDNTLDSRLTTHSKNERQKRGKSKEKERDLSFVILPRSASSLVPGKSSNIVASMLPPSTRLWREDRLPKHSNLFTGIPTPTDSRVTSARNSQHILSKPGTPVQEHPLRPSRSVPDWTSEQRKQYCCFEDASENSLPCMPSAYELQPTSGPGKTAEGVETLERATRERDTRDYSPKLAPFGRYKKQKGAESNGDESLHQQKTSRKSLKLTHGVNDGTQEKERPSTFLGADGLGKGVNGLGAISLPIQNQPQQQPLDRILNPQNLLQSQYQIRRRSTAPASVTDDDQRHAPSTSQHRPERPTSTSTYQAHRGHPLYPVVEETHSFLPLPKWDRDWSPHLQQGSELFFETGTRVVHQNPTPSTQGTSPLVEMGIPSPQKKTRPASWACPIRPTAGVSFDLVNTNLVRHPHELDLLFPPTPPSSTGDVWDDTYNSLDIAAREYNLFWDILRHSWNVFILIWALLLIFKSVQFVVRAIEIVILDPMRLFSSFLRHFAEG